MRTIRILPPRTRTRVPPKFWSLSPTHTHTHAHSSTHTRNIHKQTHTQATISTHKHTQVHIHTGVPERSIRNKHDRARNKNNVVDDQTPRQLLAEKVLARNDGIENLIAKIPPLRTRSPTSHAHRVVLERWCEIVNHLHRFHNSVLNAHALAEQQQSNTETEN